jgi:predicted signal transduction protein with EAL and GGDEF domain
MRKFKYDDKRIEHLLEDFDDLVEAINDYDDQFEFSDKKDETAMLSGYQNTAFGILLSDSVSRLGGDEFALLVSKYKTQVELDGHLNRIITAIAQPYTISGHDINISMSLGVAIYPTDHTEADVLLRLADHALYDAKKAGGNQYSMFIDN